MEKIIRTPDQIRAKLEGWLISHEQKKEEKFDGKETFTLFSKLSKEILAKLEGIYSDFHRHLGFTSITARDINPGLKSVKAEGYFQEFEIKTKSGKILNWTLPRNTKHTWTPFIIIKSAKSGNSSSESKKPASITKITVVWTWLIT